MDPVEFIKKPQVICRLLSALFSIVVFGCISDGGKVNGICLYDGDSGACDYGIAIGVIAFIACLLFLATDFFMESLQNVEVKKYIMLADLLFSALWTFLWFVGFCYLCDKWRKTGNKSRYSRGNKDHAQAPIAFCFFSIFSWGVQTFLAYRSVNDGTSNFEFGGGNTPQDNYENAPYSTFPGDNQSEEPYQAKPFDQSEQSGEYRPPTY